MNANRVAMRVNGEDIVADVPARLTLAGFLRDHLGLKGTHLGCEEGVCGNCTVLVDGISQRSCMALAVQMEGAAITTVEGYAAQPALRPIPEAFVRNFAAQCGFCTPGMMAVAAELMDDPAMTAAATDADIRRAVDTVICRCTGYQAIVSAVRDLLKDQGNAHGR